MEKKAIRFSCNWNNKLNCTAFSTIRLWNPEKYSVGQVHSVIYETRSKVTRCPIDAEIMYVRKIKGSDLNEAMCLIDTGYSLEETKKALRRMYEGKDIEVTDFAFVVYRYKVEMR